MRGIYKFQPEQFRSLLSLSDDLSGFYDLYERYSETKSREDWFAPENHWENLLYFTIKHREVEGSLSPPFASDMRMYCEELMYG